MTESVWNEFRRIDFLFEGMDAILIFPKKPNKNKNWLLKTEYFGAFPNFQIEMLERGWHLAYLKNETRWCHESDLDRKKRFCEYLSQEFGLYKKCSILGMSCGGLIGTKFAAKYPECVAALYLDAPVMNLLSCPAGLGRSERFCWSEFADAMGMDMTQLISYREHPIDKMHLLLENNMPIVMAYGDVDEIVPYEENGQLLEDYYRANGGTIVTFCRKGCGHHPHGLDDNTPIIQFIEKYCE